MDSDSHSDQPASSADEAPPFTGEAPAHFEDADSKFPADHGEPTPIAEADPASSEDSGDRAAPVADSSDPLREIADRASRGRLPAADEEQAAQLVAAALGEGRDGLARVVEQLPRLPWIIGVIGVSIAWPEMKPAVRNRLLASLARVDTDAARRVRLSLARGLFKLDPAVAAKLAVGVAKEIRDKETGAVAPKHAQVFANVLIGRAKPWLAQLPLGDLKPIEGDVLVQCALTTVFLLPHTPATQLGVLKWAAAAGKLAKLSKGTTDTINKGLTRWSGKWQGVLRREVEGLPEDILSTLKPDQPAAVEEERGSREPRRGQRGRAPREEREQSSALPEGEPDPEEEASPREPRSVESDADADTDADADDDDDEREEDGGSAPAPARPRPVYESKTVPPREPRERDPRDREREARERERKPAGNFNLSDTLRQIDSFVASLRSELSVAQGKLRQREDDSRKHRKPDRASVPIIPGEPSAEELARLNVQLETRNAELQQRIEELTVDSEDRAAAAEIASGAPIADEDKRLRQLLMLKLQESYDDFLALESESPDIVAPKHYRTVLGHVFQVLAGEGIFTVAPPVD